MNMTRWDRLLSGFAITIAGLIGAGFPYVLGMEVKLETAEERVFPRRLFVQGDLVVLPPDQNGIVCPAILKDGSLDPAHKFDYATQWDSSLEETEDPLAQLAFWNLQIDWRSRDPFLRREYAARRNWTWQLTREPYSYWIGSPDLGLLRVSGEGRLEGSLTDEGWIAHRRAGSSFQRALEWRPEPPYGGTMKISPNELPFVVYLTGEGLYRADLAQRKIARLAPVDGTNAVLWRQSRDSRAVHALTSDQLYRVPLESEEAMSAVEIPASVRESGPYEIAAGSEGRLILRGTRGATATAARYQVVVLNAHGIMEKEYAYEFAPPGFKGPVRDPVAMDPRRSWKAEPRSKLGGYLAAAAAPVAWRAVRLLPEEFSVFCRRKLDFPVWFGGIGISLVFSALLAAFVIRPTRPHFADWRGPLAWAGFVLLFGIAGFLTWMLLGGYERVRPCERCGSKASSRFAACPRCGASRPGPKLLGVEILRAPRVG